MFLELTEEDGNKSVVNMDNVGKFFTEGGCLVLCHVNSQVTYVTETYDEVVEMIRFKRGL